MNITRWRTLQPQVVTGRLYSYLPYIFRVSFVYRPCIFRELQVGIRCKEGKKKWGAEEWNHRGNVYEIEIKCRYCF